MNKPDELLTAAIDLLLKISDMTSEDFSHGGEKAEREALRDVVAERMTAEYALRRLAAVANKIVTWRTDEGIADIEGSKFAELAAATVLADLALLKFE